MSGVFALGRVLRTRLRLHRVAQIFRIRLRVHPSWSVAFILIAAITVTQFAEAYPFWQRIVLGVAASSLFFLAVGAREISLNFLALSKGVRVKRITLFVFGGVSQIAREDTLPVLEVLLAMSGLLCNLIITGIFYGVYSILVSTGSVLITGLILWLAFLYFLLTLFHFIPAFPLDGGKLLRVVLWKMTGDYDRATRIASWVGHWVGLLFIAGGVLLLVFARQWFNGLVLVFFGWALQIGATKSRQRTLLREALRGITAREVMARECPIIRPKLSLGQLVRDYMLVAGHRYFVVARGVRLEGIVSMRHIKKVPKAHRDSTTVGEIMMPAGELRTARAEQSASSLLEQMNEWRIDHMPVLEKGRVIGIVLRDNLVRLLKTRRELKK